jgi:hypothetical protein
MQALSFEQSPPLSVPLRFFLTAPLFGIAAGLLLAWGHADIFASRWTPAALATVHLTTVGFMLQIMTGALFQFMPAAVGANLPWARPAARLIHATLGLGGLALVTGFLLGAPLPLEAGALGVGLGMLVLVALGLTALARRSALGPTVPALRLALAGLAAAIVAGATLALVRAGYAPVSAAVLSPRHVGWALGGWGLGLLAAVAWQVVPMFQLTPPYRPALARAYTWVLAAVLVAGAAPVFGAAALLYGLAALAAAFAIHTLLLQARRRRARTDATFRFWQLAMVALLAAVPAAVLGVELAQESLVQLAGILLLVGVFPAVMMGMLYKIVPFVIWLNLKNRVRHAPQMPKIIPEAIQARHVQLHLAALLALLPAPWLPVLAVPGGLLLAASNLWLLRALVGALRCHRESMAGG